MQSDIQIKFTLSSIVYEDRVKQLILSRDQWQAKGNGGETPFFKGSATTRTARGVDVVMHSNYAECDGDIFLTYPECSPREGYGLLTQILEELLGRQAVQVYAENKPPVPIQWQGISVECDGKPLHFNWTRPQPWGDWFWQPVEKKVIIIEDEYDECDIA